MPIERMIMRTFRRMKIDDVQYQDDLFASVVFFAFDADAAFV
jgi:hypothetical protein